jgi:ribonuclease P protein subunit RPR2
MAVQPAEALTSSMRAATTPAATSVRPRRSKQKKGGPQPRLPPHFARDVGHIVFRGHERLDVARSIS